MSNRFVNHPSEVVSIGSEVTVRVYKIDEEKGQFSLTMKTQEQRTRRRNEEPVRVELLDTKSRDNYVYRRILSKHFAHLPIKWIDMSLGRDEL